MSKVPLFKHDCDNCVFLGHVTDGQNIDGDAYICTSRYAPKEFAHIILFRYGDDGASYHSICPDSKVIEGLKKRPQLALAKAFALAEAKGLLT